jgi:hypothetical protein
MDIPRKNYTKDSGNILLLNMVVLGILVGCGRSDEYHGNDDKKYVVRKDNAEIVGSGILNWRYILHPASDADSSAEWQMFHIPKDIVVDSYNYLIVSDSGNQRVVRFSIDGRLIETIGREGQGPGEFERPRDLLVDRENSVLWVFERERRTISLFQLGEFDSHYLESRKIPEIGAGQDSGVLLQDESSFWISPRGYDELIKLIDLNGNTIIAFGDRWIPEAARERRGLLPIYNIVHLAESPGGGIVVLWQSRPVYQLWTQEGHLVEQGILNWPEFQTVEERVRKEFPAGAVPDFISSFGSDCESGLGICATPVAEHEHALSLVDLKNLNRIHVWRLRVSNEDDLGDFTLINRGDHLVLYGVTRLGEAVIEAIIPIPNGTSTTDGNDSIR